MSVHYSAVGATATYTITRDVAGGPFTPHADGVAIRPADRLRSARSACVRHNGGPLEWVDIQQVLALGYTASRDRMIANAIKEG